MNFDQAMMDYMASRNLDGHAASVLWGWYPAFFKGPRIIVPCIRTDEKNFFQARLLDNLVEKDMIFREWKRWESPFGKRGDALCWLESAGSSTCVVVEGPLDAMAAAQTGASAIATLGVGAPGPVLAHAAIMAQKFKRVILVPDRDEVSQWMKIQGALGYMGIRTEIRMPTAKDLADMSPTAREELIFG